MHKVRVKLIDFGVQRIADVSDFGYLDTIFDSDLTTIDDK